MTNRDQINRTGWIISGAAAACGIVMIVGARWIFEYLQLTHAATAFAFDPDFLPAGGAMVALLWVFSALLYAVVFVEGHWRPLTRMIGLAGAVVWFAALTSLVTGPRIYLSPRTDETAKGWIALIALFVLIDLGMKFYRYLKSPQATDVPATK